MTFRNKKNILLISAAVIVCIFVLLVQGFNSISSPKTTYEAVAKEIIKEGDKALSQYTPETGVKTGDAFSRIYFDIFEGSGMEMVVGEKSIDEKVELEAYFSKIISSSMKGAPSGDFDIPWQKLCKRLMEIGSTIEMTEKIPITDFSRVK